jgi:hypothetical protein
MTKRSLVIAVSLGALLACPGLTEAKPTCPEPPPKWELLGVFALGGAPFSAIPTRWHNQSYWFSFYHALRLRFPRISPLALEANVAYSASFGIGVNLLIDVIRTERWRVHLIDPGIFINLHDSLTATNWERRLDLTLGGGFEYDLKVDPKHGDLRLTFDVRWFIPEPVSLQDRLGAFSVPIYEDAAKGVQLWIGIARRF